ncbi:MAG: response regulator [Pyrinomonadaceae bacterium]
MQACKTVLYLDDNDDHRDLLKYLFEDAGYKIVTCSKLDECLEQLSKNDVSAVIMDYWIEGVETFTVGEKIRIFYPKIPFFYFTGDARTTSRQRAMSSGAQAYLLKPDDIGGIVQTIDKYLGEAAGCAA